MISLGHLMTRVFGDVFGPTYHAWLACLKAAVAESLTADELATFQRLAGGRSPPKERVTDLVAVIGRGGAKTQMAAFLSIWLAGCCEWPVSPGQVPMVLLLARDKPQADVAYRFVLGLLESAPMFANEIASQTASRIVLKNGVEIVIATSDFRAIRGRSLIACVCDELAFWDCSPTSASPDTEVLTAARPGLARFKGSMLVMISSAYAQAGELYEHDRRFYGTDDPRTLVIRGTTLDFNPVFDAQRMRADLERDHVRFSAEYLSVYRTDRGPFVDLALIESCTRDDPRERGWRATNATGTPTGYVAGLDHSSGRGDATGVTVSHRDGDTIIVDACRRWPAPHDPQVVAHEVAAFLKTYHLTTAVADEYAAGFSRTVYQAAGVTLITAPGTRSDAYLHLLPLMTQGVIELPPDKVLETELLSLERKTGRNGRDTVDHRAGASDDLSNSMALSAWQCARSAAHGGDAMILNFSDYALRSRELGPVGRDFAAAMSAASEREPVPAHPRDIGDARIFDSSDSSRPDAHWVDDDPRSPWRI